MEYQFSLYAWLIQVCKLSIGHWVSTLRTFYTSTPDVSCFSDAPKPVAAFHPWIEFKNIAGMVWTIFVPLHMMWLYSKHEVTKKGSFLRLICHYSSTSEMKTLLCLRENWRQGLMAESKKIKNGLLLVTDLQHHSWIKKCHSNSLSWDFHKNQLLFFSVEILLNSQIYNKFWIGL